jgi:hypothetical protein
MKALITLCNFALAPLLPTKVATFPGPLTCRIITGRKRELSPDSGRQLGKKKSFSAGAIACTFQTARPRILIPLNSPQSADTIRVHLVCCYSLKCHPHETSLTVSASLKFIALAWSEFLTVWPTFVLLWNVTSGSLVERYQHVGRNCCFCLHSNLKTTTGQYIPENSDTASLQICILQPIPKLVYIFEENASRRGLFRVFQVSHASTSTFCWLHSLLF